MTGWGQEIGPFNLNLQFQQAGNATSPVTGVNLTQNPYAFNAVANVLYIDNPVGTGLSYSDNPDDYSTNDTQTQSDLQEVIRMFFNAWPDFQNSDFYIAGDWSNRTIGSVKYFPFLQLFSIIMSQISQQGLSDFAVNLQTFVCSPPPKTKAPLPSCRETIVGPS